MVDKTTIDPENIEEGEIYENDELPESDMNNSGKLEIVDREGTLAARFENKLVEFERTGQVRCTDVKYVGENGDVVEENP